MMEDRDSADGPLTLESWLSQVRTESSKESVLVLNPESITPKGFKKPYVMYTVQLVLARDHPSLNDGEPTTIDVQRRFSEFEALRKILKALCTYDPHAFNADILCPTQRATLVSRHWSIHPSLVKQR